MAERDYRNSPFLVVDGDGRIRILPQERYKQLKARGLIHTSAKGNIWIYETTGRHRMITPNELKAVIKEDLPVEHRTFKHWDAIYSEFITDPPNVEENDWNDDETIINFANCILDIHTGEQREHSPKYLSTNQIPCNFVPYATIEDAPFFKKVMDDVFGDDYITRDFMLSFMGAVISNVKGWRFKKCLLCVGPGNSGKSLTREMLMHLIGLENCVSIDLKKLNERFGTSALYTKRLAGSGDMAYVELPEVHTLKQLTGGDELFAEFKGKDSFTFRYNGLIWCNCNRLPYFRSDRGKHVYERFLIVHFPNIIPPEERDPLLLDKLLAEKDAIASIAVKAFMPVIKNGYRFVESEAMQIDRDRYEIENNSLLTFVDECCQRGRGATRRSDFNRQYFHWCRANHIHPERPREIEQQLEKAFGITSFKSKGHYVYHLEIDDEKMADIETIFGQSNNRH